MQHFKSNFLKGVVLGLFTSVVLFFPVSGQSFDYKVVRTLNLDRNTNLDPAFKFLSKTATPVSLGVPLTLLLTSKINSDKEQFRQAIYSGIAISSAMVLSTILKYSINRQRPYEKYPDIQALSTDFTPSFPSGHTTSAFCTATTLSLMYRKWYVVVPSYTWAALVGYSRLHMGMHYLSDVIGGIIIGMGTSYLAYKLFYK